MQPLSPLHSVRTGYRGEVLAVDLVGKTGTLHRTANCNKNLLVILDLFSRFVHASRLSNPSFALAHEPLARANDMSLADSPIHSSAHNSVS